ncbi:Uncharacterized protein Adt_43617 [Abeliophyllum distichum]|uniref:Uncharacterized protein n=1 Tax=Abeliophyllum distichum TaxID=126358 RepID=A0ABD1P8J8_9LAMI
MKVCTSILELEASRDGTFRTSGELYPLRTDSDGGMWQQAYLDALTKLEVTYHSFTRAEQEWKLAQSNMEAASSGLVSATNELCIASVKAKSASELDELKEGASVVRFTLTICILCRQDLAGHDTGYDTEEGEMFYKEDGENYTDSVGLDGAPLQDKGWLSPPESISGCSTESGVTSAEASIAESGVTSAEASIADSLSCLDLKEPLSGSSDNKENRDLPHYLASYGYDVHESPLEETDPKIMQEISSVSFVPKDETSLLNHDKVEDESLETSFINTESGGRAVGGKNAYAMSIFRRVEMKLDGQDIIDNKKTSANLVSHVVRFKSRKWTDRNK